MIYQKLPGTLTVAISGTSSSASHVINGQLGPLIVNVPALTGTGTVTVIGTDNLGGTIYGIGTAVESTVAVIAPVGTPTFFDGTLNIVLNETSGTQAAAADIRYNLYYAAKQG